MNNTFFLSVQFLKNKVEENNSMKLQEGWCCISYASIPLVQIMSKAQLENLSGICVSFVYNAPDIVCSPFF